ncbi:MAG: hypothetical protein ABMA02_15115 [Saprospiraceae bacterium]
MKLKYEASTTKGFKYNASATAPHYAYDANSNLTQNNHKFLTITYNHLNLPNSMYHPPDLSIVVSYTADGEKLTKAIFGSVRNYVGGIKYLNAALDGNGTAVTFRGEAHYYPFDTRRLDRLSFSRLQKHLVHCHQSTIFTTVFSTSFLPVYETLVVCPSFCHPACCLLYLEEYAKHHQSASAAHGYPNPCTGNNHARSYRKSPVGLCWPLQGSRRERNATHGHPRFDQVGARHH